MNSARRRKGFTLIEAMVGVVLLGIGIVSALAAFGSMTNVENSARQTEKMQRMAQAKLAELVATGQADTSTNGDFSDQNEPTYTWTLETGTSGITDLNSVSLTVEHTGAVGQKTRLDTLVYVPPVTTTVGGTAQ